MDKRYQVFVSSTYKDLQEERKQVIQALLELNCIPSGMELFQASDDDQWTLIKRVIDECDYYLVIIAGRYGSMRDGVGYTEMEYDYAVSRNKPVIAFLHSEPGSIRVEHTDKDADADAKLVAFREKARKKVCREWKTAEDLGGKVSRSVVRLIKDKPAEGWVKSRFAADPEEILRLRSRIEELETDLDDARTQPPIGADELAQGYDLIALHCDYARYAASESTDKLCGSTVVNISWNELFKTIALMLFHQATDRDLRDRLDAKLSSVASVPTATVPFRYLYFNIAREDFETIKIQFIALGLMKKSDGQHRSADSRLYWSLTPYCETYMMQLMAVKR